MSRCMDFMLLFCKYFDPVVTSRHLSVERTREGLFLWPHSQPPNSKLHFGWPTHAWHFLACAHVVSSQSEGASTNHEVSIEPFPTGWTRTNDRKQWALPAPNKLGDALKGSILSHQLLLCMEPCGEYYTLFQVERPQVENASLLCLIGITFNTKWGVHLPTCSKTCPKRCVRMLATRSKSVSSLSWAILSWVKGPPLEHPQWQRHLGC